MEPETVHSARPGAPGWPLPLGHRFGPQGLDLRNHDGRSSIFEAGALRAWQLAYAHRIKRESFQSGYYDAITQKAALHVQQLASLPRTGLIDSDTWAAVWTVDKPRPEPPAGPPKPNRRVQRLRAARQRDYWRRVSEDVTYTGDGSQPPWWPGRPFGPGEYGWHVEVVQELLQARKTRNFGRETAARVRAFRRAHGLPVSEIVDLPVAVLLDPGPW